MKKRGNEYFLLLISAVILVFIVSSLTMESLSSKLLPLLIGGGTLVLVTRELVRDLRNRKTLAEDNMTTSGASERRGYLVVGIWLGGFILVVYLLGFIIAIALFVLTYMKMHGTRWLQSIVCAVLTTAAIYGIFQYAMKVELYQGLLFTIFG